MKLNRKLKWLSAGANTIVANISVVLFVIMTLIIWAQIFYRFVLGDGIVWAEEIAKYLMVWMALLGASVVYYEQRHIAIEFFISRRPGIRVIKMAHTLMGAALFIVLIVCGIKYAKFGQKFISPGSGIQKFWPYLAIPVGGGFLLFQSVLGFMQLLIDHGETVESDPGVSEPKILNRKESLT